MKIISNMLDCMVIFIDNDANFLVAVYCDKWRIREREDRKCQLLSTATYSAWKGKYYITVTSHQHYGISNHWQLNFVQHLVQANTNKTL